MQKEIIKNRKGQKLAVVIEKADQQKGLAFVAHGLGGFKEQPHIRTIAEAFIENNYTVITFDATNTLGESEGSYEDATTTNYYEDLEDVIKWAGIQAWYQEPFVMAGHSLGGITVALFAEKFPKKIKALAPVSTAVSGCLSVEAHKRYKLEEFNAWGKTGWLEQESNSKPGIIKRLKWSHVADRLRYDLLPNATKLTMPTLLIAGENDTSTPPEHQKILYKALSGMEKELYIIKGAPHTFRDSAHLAEIKQIFNRWLIKIEK